MELIAVEDGFITYRVHWKVARVITEALKCANGEDISSSIPGASVTEVDTLAAAFEAATMAGNLQLASHESEAMTLAWLRETGGDRVAVRRKEVKPHERDTEPPNGTGDDECVGSDTPESVALIA